MKIKDLMAQDHNRLDRILRDFLEISRQSLAVMGRFLRV